MGSNKAGPAERQSREQGQRAFNTAAPMIEQLSFLISKALGGDTSFFESSGLGQRKASQTAQAGAQQQERTRQRLSSQGLEQTGAGQAALQDMEGKTNAAVLDAILGEMERYINIAPQFSLGLANVGTQGTATAAQAEANRGRGSDALWGSLIGSLGMATGAILGGPIGAGLGAGIASLFTSAPPPPTNMSNSWMGVTPPKNVQDVSIGGGFVT